MIEVVGSGDGPEGAARTSGQGGKGEYRGGEEQDDQKAHGRRRSLKTKAL